MAEYDGFDIRGRDAELAVTGAVGLFEQSGPHGGMTASSGLVLNVPVRNAAV